MIAISQKAKKRMNQYGKNRTPFLFILDFELKNPIVIKLEDVDADSILFNIGGFSNSPNIMHTEKEIILTKFPVSFETYYCAFQKIMYHLYEGNTYLLNLTFPTPIECSLSLLEIYNISRSKFKLYLKNKLVVFSPEIFVQINGNNISSYPMKGTIDASIPNAEQLILSDEKEKAEHATIVDLIRNDLSMIANEVKVESYRYIDKITTNNKTLLQVSSKITGKLPDNYNEYIGDILFKLLPAGSISGAPKKKTLEIIKDVENYDRGYYTGIFGYYDGAKLDSGVMIRFIENINEKLYFKSGGGITSSSDAKSEYQEMIDKIYVPIA